MAKKTRTLNAHLAARAGSKTADITRVTALYRKMKSPEGGVDGFNRVYKPFNEGDKDIPTLDAKDVKKSTTTVWDSAGELIEVFAEAVARDVTISETNAQTKVSFEMVGKTYDVSPESAMAILNTVDDLIKIAEDTPRLDPANDWVFDPAQNRYKTAPEFKVRDRTEKVPIELSPATEKHPAQVQLMDKKVLIGNYEVTKISGAARAVDVEKVVKSLKKLKSDITAALAEANSRPAEDTSIDFASIFNDIFKPLRPM